MIKLRLSNIIFIIAIILSIISICNSQTIDTMKVDLSDVTILGSIRAENTAPISITNISSDKIKETLFGQELPQFLFEFPSITYNSDAGSMNGYSYMRMRGIDNVRINYTLNGVPLNEPEDQGAYFNNYVDFLNNVESIQIQRGVGTSTNGVASYGGSINFQSKYIEENYMEYELLFGSYNTQKFSIYSTDKHDNLSMSARLSLFKTSGYRDNSGNNSTSVFINSMYTLNKDVFQLLSFYGHQRNDMCYLATSIDDLTFNPKMNYLSSDEDDEFDYYFNQLQYTHQFDENLFSNTSIYYIHLNGNYDVKLDEMYNFRLKSNFLGGIFNINYKSTDFNVSFGVHVNTYTRYHMMGIGDNVLNIYDNNGNKNELSSFIKTSYQYKDVLLYGDLQYRHIIFKYNPDDTYNLSFDNVTWNFLNPKVGLSLLQNNFNYYVSFGIMHREPTRNDLFGGADDIDINNYDELKDFNRVKPEIVYDTEFGVKYHDSDLNGNINLFNMQFNNEIAQIGQISYIGLPLKKNVESSYRRGIELEAEYKFIKHVSLYQNLTVMKSKINTYTRDYDNECFNDVVPLLSPSVISMSGIKFNSKYFNMSVYGKYISESYLDNENTGTVPSAFIVNVNLSVNSSIGVFQLICNNVFDKTYYSSGYMNGGIPYYYIQSPFNMYLTVKTIVN